MLIVVYCKSQMHTLRDPLKSQKGECDITLVLLFLALEFTVIDIFF